MNFQVQDTTGLAKCQPDFPKKSKLFSLYRPSNSFHLVLDNKINICLTIVHENGIIFHENIIGKG
jgi:hypothetical protein